jgi:hypothetical protein
MALPKHWEELTFFDTPDDIINEFGRKYSHSYVWFCVKDKKPILCWFNEWDGAMFKFKSSLFGELSCKLDSEDITIRAGFPNKG